MVEGKVRSAPCVGHGGNTLSACAGAWRRCGKVQAASLLLGIVGGSVFETSPTPPASTRDGAGKKLNKGIQLFQRQCHCTPATIRQHPTRTDEVFAALVMICFALIVRAQRCDAQRVAH